MVRYRSYFSYRGVAMDLNESQRGKAKVLYGNVKRDIYLNSL